ncbi:unnamed protein product, partial [marine sediment metagenome]
MGATSGAGFTIAVGLTGLGGAEDSFFICGIFGAGILGMFL